MKFSSKSIQFDLLQIEDHHDSLRQLTSKVAKAREETIMHQLNDFISRDLISIEVMGGTFVRMADSNAIEYRESVRLVLKDKEYIEKLEKENAGMKEWIEEMKKLIGAK